MPSSYRRLTANKPLKTSNETLHVDEKREGKDETLTPFGVHLEAPLSSSGRGWLTSGEREEGGRYRKERRGESEHAQSGPSLMSFRIVQFVPIKH